MSYYHELYVVCDECHTSLLVDEATYEDADNDAADEGWQVVVGIEDKHYCPRHWHVKCHDCDAAGSGAPDELERQDGGSIATIRVTASVPNAPNLPDGELQLVRS